MGERVDGRVCVLGGLMMGLVVRGVLGLVYGVRVFDGWVTLNRSVNEGS